MRNSETQIQSKEVENRTEKTRTSEASQPMKKSSKIGEEINQSRQNYQRSDRIKAWS